MTDNKIYFKFDGKKYGGNKGEGKPSTYQRPYQGFIKQNDKGKGKDKGKDKWK